MRSIYFDAKKDRIHVRKKNKRSITWQGEKGKKIIEHAFGNKRKRGERMNDCSYVQMNIHSFIQNANERSLVLLPQRFFIVFQNRDFLRYTRHFLTFRKSEKCTISDFRKDKQKNTQKKHILKN